MHALQPLTVSTTSLAQNFKILYLSKEWMNRKIQERRIYEAVADEALSKSM